MYLHNTETNRLKIRKLELSDIDEWEQFFVNNPNIEYLGLDDSLDNQSQAEDWIKRQLLRYESNGFGHHALIEKESGKFIGQCGLLTQEIEGKIEIELGYHILPEFWGNGFATEAAKKFKTFAFAEDICSTLISVIDIRNTPSQNVARKLGMQAEKQIPFFGLEVFIFRTYK